MTRLAPRRAREGWSRLGGTILLLLAVAACGSGSPSATTTSTPAAAASSPSGPDGSATSAAAVGVLDAALAPLRGSSAFSTTVAIDDVTAVTMTGRSAGAASMATVTTGSRTVDYVVIPPKAWARDSGGTWVLIAADTAPTAPLDVLSAPTSVTGDGSGPGAILQATYPAAALGLTGDPVQVTVTLGSTVVKFSYAATTGGHTTRSTTTIRPAAADPIAAPAP